MSAFWDLSTCRSNGFSVGLIPWNRVREYAEFAGLDRDNAFTFTAIIRRLDEAYLEWADEEQKKKGGKPAREEGAARSH